jgi:lipopolysaccharide export system permease protein
MFRIKKLDLYIFSNFIGVFSAAFLVSLFVLLMQFLYRYMDDLMGKGFDTAVMLEFFFYAALSLVPMALPLAILLSSLMTFGNLGERFELTAMKAAGIPLHRIMLPLLYAVIFFSFSSFLFANNIIPHTQKQLRTLIRSIQDTNTEVSIPTGVFYTAIPGYNIYVREEYPQQKLMKDVMIYDFSAGFENAVVTVAEAGRLQFTDDGKYIVLSLYEGESFENLRRQTAGGNSGYIPFRRETFGQKQLSIAFDSNLQLMDASMMQGQYVTKNVVQLGYSMDSLLSISDSLRLVMRTIAQTPKSLPKEGDVPAGSRDTTHFDYAQQPRHVSTDSLFHYLPKQEKLNAVNTSIFHVNQLRQELQQAAWQENDAHYLYRRHGIEWHRKFTLAFACIVFFFIGAPLGALIRKGGLGMPVVVSVFLFIFYYIVDNTGYKFARDGAWTPAEGMWLSALILALFGAFLTYRAVKDNMSFDFSEWRDRFRRKRKKPMQ